MKTSTPLSAASRRQVLGLAVPIILANLTQPLLAAVDTAVAGHLGGAAPVGGVAQGGLLLGFVFWGLGFLRMGTSALVAQAHGAQDEAALAGHLSRALLLALGLGLLVLMLGAAGFEAGLKLLGGSTAVRAQAHAYGTARLMAAPFVLANYVLLGYLLGRQQVRLALALQVAVNLINLLALLIAVGVLEAGVRGIGAATAVADAGGFVLGWLALRLAQGHWPRVRWRERSTRGAWARLLGVNRDIFLRTACLLAVLGVFSRRSAEHGDVILAANAVLQLFGNVTSYALDGFAQAAETLVGAAVGRGDVRALREALRASLLLALSGALAFAALYALAGGVLIEHLTDAPAIAAAARQYLPWTIVMPLAACGGFILDGVFIGATRTRALMASMFVAAGFFASTLYAARDWANHGLWLALIVFMLARGLALAACLPGLLRTTSMPARAA